MPGCAWIGRQSGRLHSIWRFWLDHANVLRLLLLQRY